LKISYNFVGVTYGKVFISRKTPKFMKYKQAEKTLKRVKQEIKGNIFTRPLFTRHISIVIPDTGALIDLERCSEDYCVPKGRDPCEFLKSHMEDIIDRTRNILIPEGVMYEVERHRTIRLNEHQFEISPVFVDYIGQLHRITREFVNKLRYGADSEQVREDVYWASRLCCKDSLKKHEEGFSDADKDLLHFACLLSKSRLDSTRAGERIGIGTVHVLSPDAHIREGIRFLMETPEYEGEYANLNYITTR